MAGIRAYNKADFSKVRDFLVESYNHFQYPHNWTIERWNFSIAMSRCMNNVSMSDWESQIAVFEQDGRILGVVNAEGEDSGEAYFQLGNESLPTDVLNQMFDFCEANLGKRERGRRIVYLRVPVEDYRLQEVARQRDFQELCYREHIAEMAIDDELAVTLPERFCFAYGDRVSNQDKGMAHAQAFGYVDDVESHGRSPKAYENVAGTPDYRSDLDIYVLSPEKQVAAFATMWYDKKNRIGNLEPVGTVPEFRRMGLAGSCIYQLINQIRAESASKVYVGSEQEFYKRLGFNVREQYAVWSKVCNPSG